MTQVTVPFQDSHNRQRSRNPTADLQASQEQVRIQLGSAVTSVGLCYAVWLAGTGPL